VGIEFEERFVKRIKESLLFENKIFTGSSKTNIIRILPPLIITNQELEYFLNIFNSTLQECQKVERE